MDLPFNAVQFVENFKYYNTSVFPAQVVLFLLAIVAIYLSFKNASDFTRKTVTALLSFLWLWMGVIYHYIFFSSINKAAYLFGSVFILQALLLFYYGIIRKRLQFRLENNIYGITGFILILYALVVYPVLGYFNGHIYPSAPTFGLPCPTTIFTFGILLWTVQRVPFGVLIIPLVWSVIGFSAAMLLGMTEDLGLLPAGLIACSLVIMRNRQSRFAAH